MVPSELDVWIPQPFHAEVPVAWWDSEADKSLLIGVFKHGEHARRSQRSFTYPLRTSRTARRPPPLRFCFLPRLREV